MSDWNQEGAPNNNLSPETINNSKLVSKNGLQQDHGSSKGGESDQVIKKQLKRRQPGMG
ncbi:hypothetical protein SAMN05192533_101243 [Mesobacillus persicus]|uniref:Uncharacterized protein n=1 Tax=Mesobacillus persicus TaxID=930146 RepID=A0A1H7W448_9BACI|nr:hypothetical protein [Mesobacillus persicus]SEM15825.1 hypothetical protein SAMN05192533_101243 [Mesobacillus persicus]